MIKQLQRLLTILFVLCLFSMHAFSVPQATFNSPIAGQTYTVGVDASIPVTFEITNPGTSNFSLYLYKADMSGGRLITSLAVSNGSNTYNYSLDTWEFPGNYKLMIKEENSPIELAYSDVFTIANNNKIIGLNKPETSITCFSMQQSMQIEWYSNAIDFVNILYSIDNGTSWIEIVNSNNSTNGKNTFMWQIPTFTESIDQCKIKVEETSGAVNIVSNVFRLNQPVSYGFSKPLGGETYIIGVNQNVPLEIYYFGCSNLNPTTAGNIFSIRLVGSSSKDVGIFDYTITEGDPWIHSYTLSNSTVSGNYYFSYSSQGKTFQSSSFIVENTQKLIDISDTSENAYYSVDQVYPIWWTAVNVAAVNIYYSTDDGSTWSDIATNVNTNNGTNTYQWTIPNSITSTYRNCKIKITDVAAQAPDDISLKFTLSNLPKLTVQSPILNSTYTVGVDTEIPFTVANNSADNGSYIIYLNDNYITSMNIDPQSNNTFNYPIPAKMNSGSYRFKIQTGSETFYSEYFNIVNNNYAYKFLDPIAGNTYNTCSSSVPVKIEFKGVGPISGSLDLEIIGFAVWANITTLNLAADGILEYSFDIPVDMELGIYRFRFSCSEGIIYSENFNIKGSYPVFPTPVAGTVFNISETSTIPVAMQLFQSCQPIDFRLYISDGNGFSQLLINSTINQSNPNYYYNYTIPSNLPSGEYEFFIERWISSSGQWGNNYSSKFIINTTPFSGGDGTQANPYQVSNAAQLNAVRNYLGAHFIQTANIDLGVAPWNEGEGWEPIGTSVDKFTGRYDGQGFTISNMKINRPLLAGVGLFGWASGATISNVKLENVDIIGQQRIGALVGSFRDEGAISNCSSTGITRGGNFTSGLVGNLYYGSSLIQSFSTCNVVGEPTSSVQIGGLVGRVLFSIIDRCYATGNVSGAINIGGLAGYVSDNPGVTSTNSILSNCYSTGDVNGNSGVGGFIGVVSMSSVTNCYSTGRVVGNGGLISSNTTLTITSSYWNTETSLQTVSAGGIGKNTAQMLAQSTFADWDFTNTWAINESTTYPYLKWQNTPAIFNQPPTTLPPVSLTINGQDGSAALSWMASSLGAPTKYKIYRDGNYIGETTTTSYIDAGLVNYTEYTYYITAVYGSTESIPCKTVIVYVFPGFQGGDGTELNPYQVSTIQQLNAVRYFNTAFFIQTANIDLGVAPWNEGEGWEPIGLDMTGTSAAKPFSGTFNGNGFTINNLTINRPEASDVGLFGYTENAKFYNLTVTNVSIIGQNTVAALVAELGNGSIVNSTSSGNLKSTTNICGGLAGWVWSSTITKSSSSANVEVTSEMAGGLVGYQNANTTISESWSSGNVSGTQKVGGLVGESSFNDFLQDCYSSSKVTGNLKVGGLVGSAAVSGLLTVQRCYSIGEVTGAESTGGLIGLLTNTSSIIENSYWNTETSIQTISAGGIGQNTVQMINQNTFNTWDFTDVWQISESVSYPYLKWQASPEIFNYPAMSLVPQNLTGNFASQTALLTWEAPLKGVPSKYEIFRDDVKVGESTVNSFADNGLINKTIYAYYVKAIHGSVSSEKSNTISLYVFSGFEGGDGTEANPYLISNAEQLDAVRYYMSSHFQQTANIDLGVAPWNEGEGWKPIGIGPNPSLGTPEILFTGFYDGGNFKISNLTIAGTSSRQFVGLFGNIKNTTIQNVECNNVSIDCGDASLGAIVGRMSGSTLSNSKVSGLVKSTSTQIGGLVGWSDASTVNNCYSSANVESGDMSVGGLVGVQGSNSKIQNSWSSGDVSGNRRVGGILGYNSNGIVQNCYSSSNVTGENTVGGLIGYSSGTSSSVSNCYAIGNVVGLEFTGGLIGLRPSGNDPVSCYWNIESCGQSTSGGGTGRATAEMLANANYTGWDFTGVWDIQDGVTYPFLKIQVSPSSYNYPALNAEPSSLTANIQSESIVLSWNAPSTGTPQGYNVYRNGVRIASNINVTSYVDQTLVEYTVYSYSVTAIYGSDESDFSNTVHVYYFSGFEGGDGTINNPYLISTAGQLNAVRYYLSSHFRQTANIDLGVSPWNDGAGWIPLGSAELSFTGSYDGGGFSINNLTINNNSIINVGLFGVAGGNDILLKNITLNNAAVSGDGNIGALVGSLSLGIAKNVIYSVILNNVSVSGGESNVGGIIGYASLKGGSIQNSSVTGTISGINGAGGIAGYVYNGSIIQCFSNSTVSGSSTSVNSVIGGLVGTFQHGSITNCYSAGSVTGSHSAGIVANINNLTIENSYSVAKINGDSDLGGLVAIGLLGQVPTVVNSYWDQESTNVTFSNGGVGKSTIEMINQSTFNSWDFGSIWSINEGTTYPYLKWQVDPSFYNAPSSSLKPVNLTGVRDNSSVALTWESPLFGEPQKYFIYRDSEKIGEANTPSFTNGGLANNITYQYYITAVFDGVETSPSNTISIYIFDGIISGTDENGGTTTAPNWTRLQQYGGSGANYGQVVTTDANSIYFVANVKGTLSLGGQMFTCIGDNDLLIAKYTKTGTPVWIKMLNAQTEGQLSADAIKVDNTGNVYLAATISKGSVTIGNSTVTSSKSVNTFIAKFDANGDGLWASELNNPLPSAHFNPTRLAFDNNGDVYLLSKSSLLLKYSANGTKIWEQSYPHRTIQTIAIKGTDLYLGGALQMGTTYFGGLHLNFGGGYNTGFIVKGDLNGNYTQALVGYNTINDGSIVSDIVVNENNELLVSGGYQSSFFMGSLEIPTNTGKYHAYLAKLDNNFNFVWFKKSSVITDNYRRFIWSTKLHSDNAGNIYQYGTNTGSFTYESIPVNILTGNQFLVKFDVSGNVIGSNSLVNTSKDRTIVSSDGNLVSISPQSGGNFKLSQYSGITTNDWEVSSTNTTYCNAIANFNKVDKYGNHFVLSTASGNCNYFGNTFIDNEGFKLLAKHDITGSVVWVKKIKGLLNGGAQGSNIALDKNNNTAIVGQFNSSLNAGSIALTQNNNYTHGVILKYNSNGDISSAIQIRNISGGNIKLYTPTFDNVGNIIVSGAFSGTIQAGNTQLYGNSMDDVFLAKYDVNGNFLWAKSFGGTDMEWMGLVACDGNNNIYLTGEFHSNPIQIGGISLSINNGSGSTVLAKLDPNGNALWAKTYGGVTGRQPDSWPVNIRTDEQGNTYLWGWCPNNSVFGSFELKNTLNDAYMYYLCKINTNGEVLWAKAIEELAAAFNYHDLMDLDSYGNVYIGGQLTERYKVEGNLYNIRGLEDFFIAKYSSNGVLQWMKSEPQMVPENGTLQSLAVYKNNTLIVSGNHNGKLYFGDKTFKSTGQNAFIAVLGELPALPVAVTKPATVNSKKSSEVTITLKGTANANNNDATVIFEYGTSTAYGSSISGTPTNISGNSNHSITASFEGLNSVVYHYRLKIETSVGNVYGDDMTISAQLPIANTIAATNIDFSSAMLNGSVNAKGNIVGIGFEYGETTSYGSTIVANPTSLSSDVSVNVSANLLDLLPNTTYHFRVYTIGENPVYGEDLTFTTNAMSPFAIVQAASSITKTNANLRALVNPADFNVTVEFEYGLTSAYGSSINATPFDITGNTLQSVNAAIGGLLPNTIYKYRVKVTGGASIVYSDEMSFTTLPEPPTVTTIAASNILATGALAHGSVNPNGATTSVYIQYGITTDYGNQVFANQSAVEGTVAIDIDKLIAGLEMNTEYHFRIKAVSAGGTTFGDDMVFTTLLESKPTVVTNEAIDISRTSAKINGLVYANGKETTIEFNYGEDNTCSQTIATTPTVINGTSEASANVESVLSGLKSNTTYYYKLKGVNSIGESVGEVKTFKTLPSEPKAVTQAASNISKTGATLSGLANANSVLTTVVFEYGLTTDYGTEFNATPLSISGNANETVTALISGLTSNTTYHFRLKAFSADGISYGEDLTFTTKPLEPNVSTLDATEIATTGAIFNGMVNANSSTSQVEFEWGTSNAYGAVVIANPVSISGSKDISVQKSVSSLLPNTTYYYRAKATNAGGVTYGQEKTFKTLALSPSLSSPSAINIATVSATLKGFVNANGDNTEVTFEYGLTNSYGTSVAATPANVSGTVELAVEASLTGLTPNTIYHFRIKAINTGGSTYTTDQTFTTATAPLSPMVTIASATDITANSAKLNGSVNANGVNTDVTFEYGLTNSYGSSAVATPSTVYGTTESAVEVSLTGLTPNTIYHYRLKAVNAGGVAYSSDLTFTTQALAPAISTLSVTDITTTGGTLNGIVNANGISTTVQFEYGKTVDYGTLVAQSTTISGSTDTNVSTTITALEPNTTYHFRLKATSNAGVAYSTDGSFTTLTTGIVELAENLVNVYPNPAKDFVYVDLKGCNMLFEFSIIDINGKTICGDKPLTDNKINVTTLAKGIYFIKLKSSNIVIVKRVVVE